MRGSKVKSNAFWADPSALKAAIAWRRDGKPYKWIASQLGIAPSTVWHALQLHDASPRRADCCSSACLPDSYHVIRLYNKGLSCKDVGKLLGYDTQVISLHVKRMGLMRNTKPYQSQIDHGWLDAIDSEVKAYFLGLLAADGWLNRNTVFIALKQSDRSVLDDIVSKAFPFVPVNTYPASYKGAEDQCRFSVTSPSWISRLNDLGITQAKSLTMGDICPLVPFDVRHHFVRGYFDGDGSIYHSVYRNKRRVTMTFRGTKAFLSGLHLATGIPVGGIYPINGEGIKSLSITGKCRMYELRDYLYRDATILLHRKWERFTW